MARIEALDIAEVFLRYYLPYHDLPDAIVSDRGTHFTSDFSRHLCKLLGIQQKLSTSFHTQTDSQTERVNAILEQYLRGYCNYQQDNWSELLTMAEFAYNNTLSATTGITPGTPTAVCRLRPPASMTDAGVTPLPSANFPAIAPAP